MSVMALAWAFRVNVGDPVSKLVLICLADHADDIGRCWPSRKTIATYAECSIDTVDRRIKKLVTDQLVAKSGRATPSGDQTSNMYVLNLGAAACGHPQPQPAATQPHPCGTNHQGTSTTPKGSTSALPTSATAKALAALFNRKLTTPWMEKEVKAFRRISIEPDDITLISDYYHAERAKGAEGNHRRDLYTFLNNYLGELDRAKAWKERKDAGRSDNRNGSAGKGARNAGTCNEGAAGDYNIGDRTSKRKEDPEGEV